MKFNFKRGLTAFLAFLIALCLLFSGCDTSQGDSDFYEEFPPRQTTASNTDKETEKSTNKVTNKPTSKETQNSNIVTEKVTVDRVESSEIDTDFDETESSETETETDETETGAIETDNTETDTSDSVTESIETEDVTVETEKDFSADPDGIPSYSKSPYIELNGNVPEFSKSDITNKSYEFYSELDSLGRCGYTIACIGKDLMPTDDRESISSVKPSGWINKAYDSSLVDGRYIYNRCHLIGFQLTGENANKQNLITGTRYMNVDGMLPFENMVADYIKETDNHVMYRVTPIYVGDNLVASGVQMEAYSVEDNGEGICFNVYVYNVQPGITINYATGDNWLTGDKLPETETETDAWDGKYILNISSKKIHKSTCSGAQTIKDHNKKEHEGSLDDLISQGYTGCGTCNPIK